MPRRCGSGGSSHGGGGGGGAGRGVAVAFLHTRTGSGPPLRGPAGGDGTTPPTGTRCSSDGSVGSRGGSAACCLLRYADNPAGTRGGRRVPAGPPQQQPRPQGRRGSLGGRRRARRAREAAGSQAGDPNAAARRPPPLGSPAVCPERPPPAGRRGGPGNSARSGGALRGAVCGTPSADRSVANSGQNSGDRPESRAKARVEQGGSGGLWGRGRFCGRGHRARRLEAPLCSAPARGPPVLKAYRPGCPAAMHHPGGPGNLPVADGATKKRRREATAAAGHPHCQGRGSARSRRGVAPADGDDHPARKQPPAAVHPLSARWPAPGQQAAWGAPPVPVVWQATALRRVPHARGGSRPSRAGQLVAGPPCRGGCRVPSLALCPPAAVAAGSNASCPLPAMTMVSHCTAEIHRASAAHVHVEVMVPLPALMVPS
mmetsp:Transcript_24280/g.67517  ORF Transcript_24280/g.67517 Transcript_24280/m.67517 type:complete len:429 (-) Transcript_24280:42-1328(-)